MPLTPEQSASFIPELRRAICTLAEALPDAASYLSIHVGERYAKWASAFQLKACPLMDEFIHIASLFGHAAPPWPTERQRNALSRGRTFVDDWPLPDAAPLSQQLHLVDWCFVACTEAPQLPADGQVLDAATRDAIARYQAWRPTYDRQREAEERAFRAAREAAAPPHRDLPHRPDPPSLLMARAGSAAAITAAGANPAPNSAAAAASLASSHLIRGLTDHWLLADPVAVRADLDTAARLMASALPAVQIHAWQYEQWQHLAIAIGHADLADALWRLRREDWDTSRIRPVNWLVCRIRILDLIRHGGLDSEIRGLLEMSRIGLFDDPLPAELQADTPLMRNWHGMLHALVHANARDFDRCLSERQTALAAHWQRGGGIAAISLADLGGLALLRTARQIGLQVMPADGPYLSLAAV